MNHGDLISGNVLVPGGRLAGVLDVGGLTAADPARDPACAWHLLGPQPRAVPRAAMGVVWYYAESTPPMSRTGRRTLERIRADG